MLDGSTVASNSVYAASGNRRSPWPTGNSSGRTAPGAQIGKLPPLLQDEFWRRISRLRAWGVFDGHPDDATLERIINGVRADELDLIQAAVNQEAVAGRRATTGEVVYYIRFGDRVKIGTTTNLRNRLGALPYDEILAVEPGGRDLERARHIEFRRSRIKGEWFRLDTRLRQHVDALVAERELG